MPFSQLELQKIPDKISKCFHATRIKTQHFFEKTQSNLEMTSKNSEKKFFLQITNFYTKNKRNKLLGRLIILESRKHVHGVKNTGIRYVG